eukprot:206900-Pelagomonas_calceolata.AAC.2
MAACSAWAQTTLTLCPFIGQIGGCDSSSLERITVVDQCLEQARRAPQKFHKAGQLSTVEASGSMLSLLATRSCRVFAFICNISIALLV